MSSENMRITQLGKRIDKLEELIWLQTLQPDCMHQEPNGHCQNTGLEDAQCSKDNCPLFDNPYDI